MLTLAVIGADNKEVKKVNLKEAIFKSCTRRQLLFDYTHAYLTNQRQGTSKVKSRGEVHGTTKKMYKQKGTGNARHGDAKANLFVGGGRAFGPKPREWRNDLPKKAKRAALISALALRQKEGNLMLVEEFPHKEIKTKTFVAQLKKWGLTKAVLVTEEENVKIWKSTRNIPGIILTTADKLNAFDIIKYVKVVMTTKALEKLEGRLS